MMCRQGDILLVKTVKSNLTGKKQLDLVVAEGSITGHHHKIVNGQVFRQRRDRWNGCIGYVVAFENCQLVHDEHKTIDLPVGCYEVIKQREVTGDVED